MVSFGIDGFHVDGFHVSGEGDQVKKMAVEVHADGLIVDEELNAELCTALHEYLAVAHELELVEFDFDLRGLSVSPFIFVAHLDAEAAVDAGLRRHAIGIEAPDPPPVDPLGQVAHHGLVDFRLDGFPGFTEPIVPGKGQLILHGILDVAPFEGHGDLFVVKKMQARCRGGRYQGRRQENRFAGPGFAIFVERDSGHTSKLSHLASEVGELAVSFEHFDGAGPLSLRVISGSETRCPSGLECPCGNVKKRDIRVSLASVLRFTLAEAKLVVESPFPGVDSKFSHHQQRIGGDLGGGSVVEDELGTTVLSRANLALLWNLHGHRGGLPVLMPLPPDFHAPFEILETGRTTVDDHPAPPELFLQQLQPLLSRRKRFRKNPILESTFGVAQQIPGPLHDRFVRSRAAIQLVKECRTLLDPLEGFVPEPSFLHGRVVHDEEEHRPRKDQ